MARAAVSLVRDPADAADARDHVSVRDRATDARDLVIGVDRARAPNGLDRRIAGATLHRYDAAIRVVATVRVADREGRGITK